MTEVFNYYLNKKFGFTNMYSCISIEICINGSIKLLNMLL